VQTSTRKNHWHCPSCGQRYLYSATKEYHTRQSSQLLALDLLDGQTLLTPLLPLDPHQENVFELFKMWTHSSYLEELLLDDVGHLKDCVLQYSDAAAVVSDFALQRKQTRTHNHTSNRH
jgi:hypothetical protein